jgi:hypothetical protein
MIKFMLLLCLSFPAFAADFSLSLGAVHTNLQGDGTWYQKGYPYKLPYNVPAIGLKESWGVGDGYSLGIGYTYAGKFDSSALAKSSDAAFQQHLAWPLSHWIGTGDVHGIAFTGRKQFHNGLFVDGGYQFTRTYWKMTVPDWYEGENPPLNTIPVANARPISVAGARQYRWSPVYSVGYQFDKHWAVSVNSFPTNYSGDYPGIFTYRSWLFSTSYTFN